MNTVDQELNELYKKILLKKKISTHLAIVQKKLSARELEVILLEEKINDSAIDLIEHEKYSLSNLFSKILGNKAQELERDRQNYLMYILQLKSCKERIASKQFEINVLQEKLQSLNDIESSYEKLLVRKKQYLKFKNKEVAKEIITLENEIRSSQYQRKEIDEAVLMGKKVIEELSLLEGSLGNLVFDRADKIKTMEFSSYQEKKAIKGIRVKLEHVNKTIDNFTDELSDVNDRYQLDYTHMIDRISLFLVNFYDGLISDWVFHKKARVSLNLILESLDKVKRIIAMLELDFEDSLDFEAHTKKRIEKILVENKLN